MYATRILLLTSFLFSIPTGSSPLHYPSQGPLLKAEFPGGVQVEKDLMGILSFGPIFIESINNGMRAKEVFVDKCNGCSRGIPPGTTARPEYNYMEGCEQSESSMGAFEGGGKPGKDMPKLNGNDVGLGLSSKEIFQTQAMDLALAEAKAKEKPKEEQTSAVKVPDRSKIYSRPGVESEAVSYMISEPSETSLGPTGGKVSAIQSDGGKLQVENRENGVLPLISNPVQKYIVYSNLIQPIIFPCYLKISTAGPKQQTTTMESTTDGDVTRSRTTVTGPDAATSEERQKIATAASTKEVRNLRSGVTSQTEKNI